MIQTGLEPAFVFSMSSNYDNHYNVLAYLPEDITDEEVDVLKNSTIEQLTSYVFDSYLPFMPLRIKGLVSQAQASTELISYDLYKALDNSDVTENINVLVGAVNTSYTDVTIYGEAFVFQAVYQVQVSGTNSALPSDSLLKANDTPQMAFNRPDHMRRLLGEANNGTELSGVTSTLETSYSSSYKSVRIMSSFHDIVYKEARELDLAVFKVRHDSGTNFYTPNYSTVKLAVYYYNETTEAWVKCIDVITQDTNKRGVEFPAITARRWRFALYGTAQGSNSKYTRIYFSTFYLCKRDLGINIPKVAKNPTKAILIPYPYTRDDYKATYFTLPAYPICVFDVIPYNASTVREEGKGIYLNSPIQAGSAYPIDTSIVFPFKDFLKTTSKAMKQSLLQCLHPSTPGGGVPFGQYILLDIFKGPVPTKEQMDSIHALGTTITGSNISMSNPYTYIQSKVPGAVRVASHLLTTPSIISTSEFNRTYLLDDIVIPIKTDAELTFLTLCPASTGSTSIGIIFVFSLGLPGSGADIEISSTTTTSEGTSIMLNNISLDFNIGDME